MTPAPAAETGAERGRQRRADAGVIAVVEQTYLEHSARLWRSVRAYCGDPDVASDAVAEAFAQLIRRGAGVEDPAAWVWRAAFRIAAGTLRSAPSRRDDVVVPDRAAPPAPEVVDLFRALAQLSPNQRAAVVLHDYAGFPARQAALVAGSTEAAMRVHLMRGRRRLRSLLADDELDADRRPGERGP